MFLYFTNGNMKTRNQTTFNIFSCKVYSFSNKKQMENLHGAFNFTCVCTIYIMHSSNTRMC